MANPNFETLSEEIKYQFLIEFKELEKIFDCLGYRMFVHGGTLLGVMRNYNLIPKDNDFDCFYICKATNAVEAEKEIRKVNSYFAKQNLTCGDNHVLGQNHFYSKQNGRHFDVWSGWIENDKLYLCFSCFGHLHENTIFPPQIKTIMNIPFYTPNDSNKFLTFHYGDWQIPADTKPLYCPSFFFNRKRISE